MSFVANQSRKLSASCSATTICPAEPRTGTMLHEVLEKVPVDSLEGRRSLEDWIGSRRLRRYLMRQWPAMALAHDRQAAAPGGGDDLSSPHDAVFNLMTSVRYLGCCNLPKSHTLRWNSCSPFPEVTTPHFQSRGQANL